MRAVAGHASTRAAPLCSALPTQFGYNGTILETFTPLGIVDQSKEEFLMWLVKKDALPWAYWNIMTKGEDELGWPSSWGGGLRGLGLRVARP